MKKFNIDLFETLANYTRPKKLKICKDCIYHDNDDEICNTCGDDYKNRKTLKR